MGARIATAGTVATAIKTIVAIVTLASCGDRLVYRPVMIDVQNMSATAQTLVLKVFAGEERSCSAINLINVQSLSTPHESRWTRDDPGERQIQIPEIDADRAVLVVYTEDASGVAIQIACAEIDYPDIESGQITLRLSARV